MRQISYERKFIVGYNQHQSFYLRERWIGKGLRAITEDPRFLFEDDAFERLGLGKNMVQSLQHWIRATKTATDEGTGKNRVFNFTKFGEWLIKNDPALTRFDTVAMLHYNIASTDEPSSTWYWLFNEFNETIFDKETIYQSLNPWIQDRETRVVAENSIIRDIDCVTSMYSGEVQPDDPEEVITSPFSRLQLLQKVDDSYMKKEIANGNQNINFVIYTLIKYKEKTGQKEISLHDLINKKGLLGKIYNMSSNTIVQLLALLENHEFFKIKFTRTNNLDMIILPDRDEEEFYEYFSIRKV